MDDNQRVSSSQSPPTPSSSSSRREEDQLRPLPSEIDSTVILSSSPSRYPSSSHHPSSHLGPADVSHSFASSYRRPSFTAGGTRPVMVKNLLVGEDGITRPEYDEIAAEETELLKDNKIISVDYGAIARSRSARSSIRRDGLSVSERTSLLGGHHSLDSDLEDEAAIFNRGTGVDGGNDFGTVIDPAQKWEEAVLGNKIETTWQRETTVIVNSAIPLFITLVLQYSLTLASVFSAGNIGKDELAAVSVAGMTANITGYAIYQGLATSLDTLCAQAYGAGNKTLVGLHMQRMAAFLMTITVPISIIWLFSERILAAIIPEPELSRLAGLYLRILIFGAPGYALFECGKRFTQSQGLFIAPTLVLCICAPLNAYLNYTLVWHPKFGIGFAGAPWAVVIIDYCMPLFLFIYVRYINGSECWGGFSKKAFSNWGPMIRLALPGLVMVEAEYLAFEALTLLASYFSTAHVAAQAIISNAGSVTYQVSFALSIATSTRVGNLLGATLDKAAKRASMVSLSIAGLVGIMNSLLLFSFRRQIPFLFTEDLEVVALVANSMPIVAAFQLADGFVCVACGVLRGQGRQYIGSYANLFAYYVVALPWSVFSGFYLGWKLQGLWSGLAIALYLVAAIEVVFVLRTNWKKVVAEATSRMEYS